MITLLKMNPAVILSLGLLPLYGNLAFSPSLSYQNQRVMDVGGYKLKNTIMIRYGSYQGIALNNSIMKESESSEYAGSSIETKNNHIFSVYRDFYKTIIRQAWWCFPMILFLVPIICMMNGSWAQMPSWWAMSNLKYLQSSKFGILICCCFLSSNVFYFLSGLYLLNVKPLQWKRVHESSKAFTKIYSNGWDPILGWLVLCSGGMSLLYHSFQALGPLKIAESLCFIDHGLAISSFLCFFDKCGVPSIKTLAIGLSSLSLLVIHGDFYPVVHSLWHLLSACTTISWATDGAEKRRNTLANTPR